MYAKENVPHVIAKEPFGSAQDRLRDCGNLNSYAGEAVYFLRGSITT
ncbi:MAG: hypothetical protein ACYSWO_24490 [Planctomycetota bacterium]|jgi:hypothetical protein